MSEYTLKDGSKGWKATISDDEDMSALVKVLEAGTITELKVEVRENCQETLAQAISPFSSINSLVLRSMDDKGATSLAEFLKTNATIKSLDMHTCGWVGNEGAEAIGKALSSNTSLETLVMSMCEIGPEGATAIAQGLKGNKTLKILNLALNKNIGDAGAVAIAQALDKEMANDLLGLGAIWDATLGLFGVAGSRSPQPQTSTLNSTLKTLVLESSGVCKSGATALAQCLHANTALENLDINGGTRGNIGDAGAEAFGKALAANSSLKTLNVSMCQFGAPGMAALAEGLKANSKLESLDMNCSGGGSCDSGGDAGAEALGKALACNSTLKTLVVPSCDIGVQGLAAMLDGLKSNTALKTLDIGRNESLADAGAEMIGKALASNASLETLGFGDCNISSQGATSLAEGLKSNSALKNLKLNWNGELGDAGAEALAQALKANTSLELIELRMCGVSDAKGETLAADRMALEF